MQNQNEKIIITTVDGIGSVEAKRDLAHFSLTVKAKSEKLENAKSQVTEKTDQVLKTLEAFKTKGVKFDTEITTSISNYKLEHREGGEKIPVGFQTTNTISWTVVIDDHMNDMYKSLLKFDSHMSPPSFSIKDRDILLEQAIVKAADDVKRKLTRECELLNISSEKLKIQNWHFGYEGHLPSLNAVSNKNYSSNFYGAQGAIGPTGPQGSSGYYGISQVDMIQPVKIGTTYQELLDYKLDAGTVVVNVAARVNYVWAD